MDDVFAGGDDAGDKGVEEPAELVDSQRDEAGWCGVSVFLGGGSDGQEGHCEYRQGGPAVPGTPSADLVFVQSGLAFRGLGRFLDLPPLAGDPDQDPATER